MAREDSSSDLDARSLTPESDEIHTTSPSRSLGKSHASDKHPKMYLASQHPTSPRIPSVILDGLVTLTPKDRFRSSVKKVIKMQRSYGFMAKSGVGAEPGIDVRHDSASLAYGHIMKNCIIEIADYSTVRSSFGKMTNREFIEYLGNDAASEREPWAKVRWINIGGVSWDVVRALALKYGIYLRIYTGAPILFLLVQICILWLLKTCCITPTVSGPKSTTILNTYSSASSAIP